MAQRGKSGSQSASTPEVKNSVVNTSRANIVSQEGRELEKGERAKLLTLKEGDFNYQKMKNLYFALKSLEKKGVIIDSDNEKKHHYYLLTNEHMGELAQNDVLKIIVGNRFVFDKYAPINIDKSKGEKELTKEEFQELNVNRPEGKFAIHISETYLECKLTEEERDKVITYDDARKEVSYDAKLLSMLNNIPTPTACVLPMQVETHDSKTNDNTVETLPMNIYPEYKPTGLSLDIDAATRILNGKKGILYNANQKSKTPEEFAKAHYSYGYYSLNENGEREEKHLEIRNKGNYYKFDKEKNLADKLECTGCVCIDDILIFRTGNRLNHVPVSEVMEYLEKKSESLLSTFEKKGIPMPKLEVAQEFFNAESGEVEKSDEVKIVAPTPLSRQGVYYIGGEDDLKKMAQGEPVVLRIFNPNGISLTYQTENMSHAMTLNKSALFSYNVREPEKSLLSPVLETYKMTFEKRAAKAMDNTDLNRGAKQELSKDIIDLFKRK